MSSHSLYKNPFSGKCYTVTHNNFYSILQEEQNGKSRQTPLRFNNNDYFTKTKTNVKCKNGKI